MFNTLSLPGGVLNNPSAAFVYAAYTIGGRFELGEELIARDAEYSYMYAKYVIREDFYYKGALVASTDGGSAGEMFASE